MTKRIFFIFQRGLEKREFQIESTKKNKHPNLLLVEPWMCLNVDRNGPTMMRNARLWADEVEVEKVKEPEYRLQERCRCAVVDERRLDDELMPKN